MYDPTLHIGKLGDELIHKPPNDPVAVPEPQTYRVKEFLRWIDEEVVRGKV